MKEEIVGYVVDYNYQHSTKDNDEVYHIFRVSIDKYGNQWKKLISSAVSMEDAKLEIKCLVKMQLPRTFDAEGNEI